MSEFNLSENITNPLIDYEGCLRVIHVKEFIKRLKEKQFCNTCKCKTCEERPWVIDVNDIDKLAGEKLI